MSELFMECEEEELEPWQVQVPQVDLVDDDDDDELIFVGELSSSNSTNPRRTNNQSTAKTVQPGTVAARLEANRTANASNFQTQNPQATRGVGQPVSQSITVAAQPLIINNQGYFVSSPQLPNNSTFITSFGKQYPPGTSFTLIPAGQPAFMPQLVSNNPTPGVIHRPQVQQISKNVVTLSNVQSPAAMSQTSAQASRLLSQPIQIMSPPIKALSTNKGSTKASDESENGIFKRPCPKCREVFYQITLLKVHMKNCCPYLLESVFPSTQTPGKRIMLVKDFYYGRHEGDRLKQQGMKTNTTFKCQSCLKVLKNNIRFMNHMKHHLDLEKQNNESWESHTTCQHCYRQYTTPFQLQCHIESAHSPFESSTNCKICELAFETEQVLLEHMKDNHKPGEMPYMCQVCNFRSSFFSEVETHFRSVHENTKDLLCPFCLKALRTGHVYMQHYMKHQKKGIHRCGKCRLNFLTYKERVDHTSQFHKTFKKPIALEGLPPGTKVTIRASFTGPAPVSPSTPKSIGSVVTDIQGFQKNAKSKPAKPKEKRKYERKHNKALKNLRMSGKHTCIECETVVDDFHSHYPSILTCGACKYRTSCKVSIGNHMIWFHSTKKDKFKTQRMVRRRTPPVKHNLTMVCLDCDLLVEASDSDRMTKHLTDRPHHVCKVLNCDPLPDASERGIASHNQQLQATTTIDALGVPHSLEPSVQNAARVQSLKSGDDVILIDDEAAPQPADAADQGTPAIDLTEDETATTPTGGLVVGEPREEQALQSGPSPPSPSVACESTVGVVRLHESPDKLAAMNTDVSEQALSPPVVTVHAEVSSLITGSPAENEFLPPDGSGLEEDLMETAQAEGASLITESPAGEDNLPPDGSGLEDDSMETVQAEINSLIAERPAEDDLPANGNVVEDDLMETVQAEGSSLITEGPAEDDELPADVSGLEDDSMGILQAEVNSLITEGHAEDDLTPDESAMPAKWQALNQED